MDPIDSLAVLSTALTSLESSLSPLLENATNLISANEEITLDKAKMDVTMAYLVHDLIWIYLKVVGIDPATHPVMEELARVKGYFEKLKSAETKETPRPKLDTAVANRFISAAIASGRPLSHKRFDEILAAKEDDEDVEMEPATAPEVEEKAATKAGTGLGKKSLSRPKMDPFAGYDDKDSPKPNSKKNKRDAAKKLNLKKSKAL